MNDPKTRPGSVPDLRRELGHYSGYGIAWVLATVLMGWAGMALDDLLGSSPLLVLVGSVLGLVGGFVTLYARTVVEPAARKNGDAENREP